MTGLILTCLLVTGPSGTLQVADSLYHQALASQGKDRVILAQRAAALWEREARERRWNGYLFYNAGVAYHLAQDLGRAILCYRKAQRLVGRFSDLEANLRLALRERKDKIEPGQREEMLRALFFWHYILSPGLRRAVFAGSFVTVWVALALRVVVRSSALSALAVLAGVVAGVFGLSVGSDYVDWVNMNHGVVVAQEVVARTGPGTSYAPAYEGGLHAGTEVRILEQEMGWLRVRLLDGSESWLPEESLERY